MGRTTTTPPLGPRDPHLSFPSCFNGFNGWKGPLFQIFTPKLFFIRLIKLY